jgi:hypothetical protein
VPAEGAGRWARPGPSPLAPPARTSTPRPCSAAKPPPSPPPPALHIVRLMDAFPVSRAAEVVDTDHDDDHFKALHAVGRGGRQRNPGHRRRRQATHSFARQEQNTYVFVARAARASSRSRRPPRGPHAPPLRRPRRTLRGSCWSILG